MRLLRSFATPLLGACLLPLPSLAAETAAAGPLAVESVSDVDTARFRALLEEAAASAEARSADPTPLVLTLADALQVALQANLQLQIAEIDRQIFEALVPAARAKFHPVPGFDAFAGSERLVDAPEDFTSTGENVPGTFRTDHQDVTPFVRQQLPTGGAVQVSAGLLRESDKGDLDPADDTGDLYRSASSIVLVQPLMRGGRVYVARREILDAEYNLSISEAQLRAQILQVSAAVKEAYYNAVLNRRLIEVSEKALERDRALLEASEALFEAGRASKRDVLSAEIRISDGESSLASNQASYDSAQLALRDVLGTPIERPVEPADSAIPFQPVPIQTPTWVSRAIESRPEIREQLVRLDQTALAVRVAENDVLPALDFLGGYQRAGFGSSSRTTWDQDSSAWETGLHFEIPFGNVAARERLRAAKLANERVERELRNLQRQIEREVRGEAISLRQSFADLAAQTAKLDQSRDKLETASTRFRLGLADNFDVTDAQEALVAAETAFLSSVVEYANSQARLEAAIAGPL